MALPQREIETLFANMQKIEKWIRKNPDSLRALQQEMYDKAPEVLPDQILKCIKALAMEKYGKGSVLRTQMVERSEAYVRIYVRALNKIRNAVSDANSAFGNETYYGMASARRKKNMEVSNFNTLVEDVQQEEFDSRIALEEKEVSNALVEFGLLIKAYSTFLNEGYAVLKSNFDLRVQKERLKTQLPMYQQLIPFLLHWKARGIVKRNLALNHMEACMRMQDAFAACYQKELKAHRTKTQ